MMYQIVFFIQTMDKKCTLKKPPDQQMIECIKCKKLYDQEDFPQCKSGYQRFCKVCKNSYERERRRNNSERTKELSRQEYLRRKARVQTNMRPQLETKKCTICSELKNANDFYYHKARGMYRAECKVCSSIRRKNYYIDNKDKIIAQTSQYKKNRIDNDVIFKLETRLRNRVYMAFTSQSEPKKQRTWKYIGCKPYFFKDWIEFQLYDGMTMNNYGTLWHIDHVIPCSSFDLRDDEEAKKCFNWSNCRPYLCKKNLTKSKKRIPHEELFQEIKASVFMKQHKSGIS